MNKNLVILGALGVFALVAVSAALVSYLSNTSETTITVNSPFTIGFYDGAQTVESLALPSVVGGDEFPFETRIVSLTSADAPVNIQFRISNNLSNVAVDDFSHVNIDVRSDGMGSYHFYDGTFSGLCSFSTSHGSNSCVNDGGDLVLTIPNWFWAGESAEIFTDLTFNLAVQPAEYQIEATVMAR